jgi:hypothetical protein
MIEEEIDIVADYSDHMIVDIRTDIIHIPLEIHDCIRHARDIETQRQFILFHKQAYSLITSEQWKSDR